MASISLLGDAYGHIVEIVLNHDYAPNNTGLLLAMDIVVPVLAIILLILYRLAQRKAREGSSAVAAL
jgi:hypothetical protein